jgi:hypothetical protein
MTPTRLYRFHVFATDGTHDEHVAQMSVPPKLDEIKAAVMPHLGTAKHLEHVAVLHWDRRCDMFVDDNGVPDLLDRNDEATKIYRFNWMQQHPEQDPETLPYIAGPAVLFEQIVWR